MRHAFYQAAATLRASSAFELPLRRMLHGLERLQLESEPIPTRRLASTTDRHLLFFDGGSRGNPGPGGSGAIVWAAAMSLASPTTTNNQAEYSGLVTGLRFASKRQLRPLTVIGDSAMIISQLRTHRAPKYQCLKERYGEARILADVLGVTEWCHHVRAFNKMADCAANLAMNSRSSVQTLDPLSRSSWSELATYIHEDVAQWQASTHPGPTSAG